MEGSLRGRAQGAARTSSGAPYLALELVDPSGRIDARVWKDVELLDGASRRATPFACSAASSASATGCSSRCARSSGRRGRSGRRSSPRRAAIADELDGFLEFLAGEITHAGPQEAGRPFRRRRGRSRARLRQLPATPGRPPPYAGGLLEHTVGVATLCRETAQLHPRLRVDLLVAAALLHDVGRIRELERGPPSCRPRRGELLGHVHLGLRLIEERAAALDASRPRGAAPRGRRRTTTLGRAHGRGGRPLPREPARRGRCDPTRVD